MTYYIGDACVDVLDRACADECPVDCIYEGARRAYINPAQCIDCGNCMQVCPVQAVGNDTLMNEAVEQGLKVNASFFSQILPGRSEPLGNPRGAMALGSIGVDISLEES